MESDTLRDYDAIIGFTNTPTTDGRIVKDFILPKDKILVFKSNDDSTIVGRAELFEIQLGNDITAIGASVRSIPQPGVLCIGSNYVARIEDGNPLQMTVEVTYLFWDTKPAFHKTYIKERNES